MISERKAGPVSCGLRNNGGAQQVAEKVFSLGATAAEARKGLLSPVTQGLPQGGHTLENLGEFVSASGTHTRDFQN